VGDGVTLWNYDYVNNRYSATVYGTYSGPQPADYANTFFRYLSSVCTGNSSSITHFLQQVYGANGANYQSWMPGIYPTVDELGNVTYSIGQPPRRTVIFGLNVQGQNTISYDDVSRAGRLTKSVDWTMAITSNVTVDPNAFVFIPPSNARSMAGPHLPGAPTATSVGSSTSH
jgi:hypothetical protein